MKNTMFLLMLTGLLFLVSAFAHAGNNFIIGTTLEEVRTLEDDVDILPGDPPTKGWPVFPVPPTERTKPAPDPGLEEGFWRREEFRRNRDHEKKRYDLNSDPNLPSDLLAKMARHENVKHRRVAASHANTKSSDLALLAKDEDSEVRILALKNEKTPTHVLVTFSRDGNVALRIVVAANERLPLSTLAMMVSDDDVEVVYAIAGNRGVHNDPALMSELYRRFGEEEQLDVERYEPFLQTLASLEGIETTILDELASHGNEVVREKVAGNASTSIDTLLALAMDDESAVRREAAASLKERHTPWYVNVGRAVVDFCGSVFQSRVFTVMLLILFATVFVMLLRATPHRRSGGNKRRLHRDGGGEVQEGLS